MKTETRVFRLFGIAWIARKVSEVWSFLRNRHINKLVCLFCFFSLMLGAVFAPLSEGADLYGVIGGAGPDTGKLIRSRAPYSSSSWYVVGNTGLEYLSALAFDPFEQRLVAGTSVGKLYILDKDTAARTKIVDRLIYDSELPPEIPELVGKFNSLRFFLTSLDFDPITPGVLYGVVRDDWGTDLLVRLNLAEVDNFDLEIDVIGVIGSTNLAITGERFGFTQGQIAFNPSTGELFGTGITFDSPLPYLIKINKTPAPIGSFVFEVRQADLIRSFPRAMTADLEGDKLYAVGMSDYFSPGTQLEVLLNFSSAHGWLDIPMHILPYEGIEGLAMGTDFPYAPPRQPVISDFYPKGGNAGIQVTVEGEAFTAWGEANVKAVYFGDYLAYSPPRVISDDKLIVTAPSASTGPIKVILFTDIDYDGNDDEATSSSDFIRSHLEVHEVEFNQGIPSQPRVCRKDTLVRLLTYSDASSAANPIPVTFGTATLRITKPRSGEEVVISPTQYTKIFSNPPQVVEPSHRHNINFYVSGDVFDEDGYYSYFIQVQAYAPDPIPDPDYILQLGGSRSFTGQFWLRFEHIPVLVVLGGIQNGGEFVGPDEGSMSAIYKVFDEVSRVFPVKNGVSRLGDDLTAGVRFEIAPKAMVLGDSLGSFRITEADFRGLEGHLTNLLDEYNDANSDHAQFVALFVGDELTTGGTFGRAQYPGYISIARIPDISGGHTSKSAVHEFGHNFYLVHEVSPNKDPDDPYHSKNNEFPPGADPREVRAFNVPGRTALEYAGLSVLPRSVMFTGVSIPDGQFFFEDEEWDNLMFPIVTESTGEPAWPNDSTMTVTVQIGDDDSAEVIQSYISSADKPLTAIDPASSYSLVFLDSSSQILAQDFFPVSFYIGDGDSPGVRTPSRVVSLVRPLPVGTAQVHIRKTDQVLASVARSGQGPNVTILFPTGGESFGPSEEVVIDWEATDPDGDLLRYSVSYSSDGGTKWLPIAAGITESFTTWRTNFAAGTTEGMIRVTATDGFNTGAATSNSFSVAPKPPMVSILQPKNGQVFQQFDSIVLEAMGFDLEHGVLEGSALRWYSVYGPLGTGRKVVLEPGILTPAPTQPITLTVTDGDSTVNKMVYITVLADSDRDGLSDEFENQYDSQDPQDPYDAGKDEDDDGLSSLQEAFFGTNPENVDSDGDGYSDPEELSNGSNPNDPSSTPNNPPVADAGSDQTFAVDESCITTVTLDGTGSHDPDNDPLTYVWTGDFTQGVVSGPTPTVILPLGTYEITLTVDDGRGGYDSDTVMITVNDTTAPVPDVASLPEVRGQCSATIDSVPAATDNCSGQVRGTTSDPLNYQDQGTHWVTWTYEDGNGNVTTQTQTVVVEDTTPPEITLSITPDTLWPPNHKMVGVLPSIQTADNCCAVEVELVGIGVNESDTEDTFDRNFDINPETGFIGNDIQVVDGRIFLRAERAGNSDGRVYTLSFSATDCNGNTSTASATVTVPHDQR